MLSLRTAAATRALPVGQWPNDVRLQALKDLDGYFPFTPPTSLEAWTQRAAQVRRQILVAEGLWPMPAKTPLHAVIHGKVERPDYTVEKIYFESTPGFFVTGSLYRPKGRTGRLPAVLVAHGHWRDARFFEQTDEALREEIATGQERFDEGGKSRFQSMCVQLARMGCVVWQWDMLGDSDSHQIPFELVHKFATQRPEMNTTANWGFFSPPAEANLQSVMGLQTLNAIRSLDFVLSLPDVDPERVGITGASGGGTQTMLLAAIDPRIKFSFPAVMVSTAMQGGCTCENASLLRVETGNVEIAGLFVPKPMGMTNANDWTKEMATKGFPELKQLYAFLGAPDNVMLHRGEHFPHNYNAVSRSAFYTWLNQLLNLGFPAPVVEHDYQRLTKAELSVWDAQHPEPKSGDPDFERGLAKWWYDDAQRQIGASAASVEAFRQVAGSGVEVAIGRTLATVGAVEWKATSRADRGGFTEMTGLLRNPTKGEELPVAWLLPKQWSGRAVVWLDDSGKAALFGADGAVRPEVKQLLDAGAIVVGADLLYQGEFLDDGVPVKRTRVVANPREFAGYTFGYNRTLFAQRVHDVLSVVAFLRGYEGASQVNPKSVDVAGFGGAGPVVAAARAIAREAIARAAVDTGGFRFGQLKDYRDPNFLPGGAKYGDVPGLLALGAPGRLWIAGEPVPALTKRLYQSANALGAVTAAASADRGAAATWLLE
ncbi:MAG: acetylxylan esterase [Opitutus sp.]|nr:acetylxylan esterase [Opitutus sp.]